MEEDMPSSQNEAEGGGPIGIPSKPATNVESELKILPRHSPLLGFDNSLLTLNFPFKNLIPPPKVINGVVCPPTPSQNQAEEDMSESSQNLAEGGGPIGIPSKPATNVESELKILPRHSPFLGFDNSRLTLNFPMKNLIPPPKVINGVVCPPTPPKRST